MEEGDGNAPIGPEILVNGEVSIQEMAKSQGRGFVVRVINILDRISYYIPVPRFVQDVVAWSHALFNGQFPVEPVFQGA